MLIVLEKVTGTSVANLIVIKIKIPGLQKHSCFPFFPDFDDGCYLSSLSTLSLVLLEMFSAKSQTDM